MTWVNPLNKMTRENSGGPYVQYPYYALLPGSPRPHRSRKACLVWSVSRLFVIAFLLVSLGVLGYMLFPRQPEARVMNISLNDINIHVNDGDSLWPSVQLDVSLTLRFKITNPNFFSVDYDKILVYFYYRGDNLGKVESDGGAIPSRSVVMADARLDLRGSKLLSHATDLISDYSKGSVPMDTLTLFSGDVDMFALKPHIEMKVYCNVLVDPSETEVLDKSCSLWPQK